MSEVFGDLIFSYTRGEALEDGVLIDVSDTAQEAGYKVPVAISSGVECLIRKAHNNKNVGSDYNGVLWDILFMSTRCFKQVDDSTRIFIVTIIGAGRQRKYQFKAVAHAGDEGECVVTIMLPDED